MPRPGCATYPAVVVRNDQLYLNDGGTTPFFVSGMVWSGAFGLLAEHTSAEIERVVRLAAAQGATTLRFNAFLKGLDHEWGGDGLVRGLRSADDGADAPTQLVRLLDAAQRSGILVQVVLGTSHWLRYGFGGADGVLKGLISNRERVENNQRLVGTEEGVGAYIAHVVRPLCRRIGRHPALMGFLVVNEGYSMVPHESTPLSTNTDVTVPLAALQRFVNRVAGELRRAMPGALLASSLKLKPHAPFLSRRGIAPLALWYEDGALVAAGGDPHGVMSHHQYQYYPESAAAPTSSPFLYSKLQLRALYATSAKPTLVGEFPIQGLARAAHNPTEMSLEAAYTALRRGGHSGGFTWCVRMRDDADDATAAAIDAAYRAVRLAMPALPRPLLIDRTCEPAPTHPSPPPMPPPTPPPPSSPGAAVLPGEVTSARRPQGPATWDVLTLIPLGHAPGRPAAASEAAADAEAAPRTALLQLDGAQAAWAALYLVALLLVCVALAAGLGWSRLALGRGRRGLLGCGASRARMQPRPQRARPREAPSTSGRGHYQRAASVASADRPSYSRKAAARKSRREEPGTRPDGTEGGRQSRPWRDFLGSRKPSTPRRSLAQAAKHRIEAAARNLTPASRLQKWRSPSQALPSSGLDLD